VDDLITEFLMETNENIAEIDADLVSLEQNPNDKNLLGKIFRLMHTIKGTCGFLGLPRLETVAHRAENVLDDFRNDKLEVTQPCVTLIFESIDRIRLIIAGLEATGAEPEGDDSDIITKLENVEAISKGEFVESPTIIITETTLADSLTITTADDPSFDAAGTLQNESANPTDTDEVAAIAKDIMASLGIEISATGEVSLDDLDAAFAAAPAPEWMNQATTPVAVIETPPAPIIAEAEKPKPAAPAPAKPAAAATPAANNGEEGGLSAQTLRVNVDVLEDLMTMVSELVLTRNQLLQIARTNNDVEFGVPLQRLNHVVSELQDGVMKTRMQPVGNAWTKLPRIIRDISIELNKKIDLEMRGQDTELDRQVLDMIKDPLTHMVRNSADHGIETPEDRIKAGKNPAGRILLNAYHDSGHIVIEISDDGKGLSTERIKRKIIENGLATADELESMSLQQIQHFIFKAGFSTAEKVTSVSGRGVGMDVVRHNIEKIGGSIELKSEEGKGSSFTIKIPLTLAIVSALIVQCQTERYAIPQLAVRELVMISAKSDQNKIEMINNTPVYRLRNQLLPLVFLNQLLGLKPAEDPNGIPELAHNQYIVVTQVGKYNFGIIVDVVHDTEEIVIKPVSSMIKKIGLFTGNTILGDGSVILILDPVGVAKATGEIENTGDHEDEMERVKSAQEARKSSILLFKTKKSSPKAVPLSLILRIERINTKDIEFANGNMVVQYRGTLMPLATFDESVEVDIDAAKEKPVLVFADERYSMGLIVDDIIDIREEMINIEISGEDDKTIGSCIINGKATDVINVAHYLGKTNKNWFREPDGQDFSGFESTDRRNVLLVDDSPFFRNMLTPILTMAGYDVVVTDGPTKALKILDENKNFDLIISDIEMPDMNGFDFVKKLKNDGKVHIPVIALSSHATAGDLDHGKAAGFYRHIPKFDRDLLIDTLSEALISLDKEKSLKAGAQ
jgi:two-component system chemotaxis sensor kinase CheA